MFLLAFSIRLLTFKLRREIRANKAEVEGAEISPGRKEPQQQQV